MFHPLHKKSSDGIRKRMPETIRETKEEEEEKDPIVEFFSPRESSEKKDEESISIPPSIFPSGRSEEGEDDEEEASPLRAGNNEVQEQTGDGEITFLGKMPSVPRHRPLWWGIGAGFFVIFTLLILLSTIFSRLTITVKPKIEQLSLSGISMILDTALPRILQGQRILPAERLEFTKSFRQEFDATGHEVIAERARGNVKIYNQFSSSAQTLVASTRFLSEGGTLYRLAKTVFIPGAKIEGGKIIPQFVEGELVADQPGEGGNTAKELTLRLPAFQGTPKYEGFYAVTPSGFSGGFRGEAKVVSKDDLSRAQTQATKSVYDTLEKEIRAKLPPHFIFLEPLREIQITSLQVPKEKTRQERFAVEVSARGRVLLFRESDLFAVLHEFILKGDQGKELIAQQSQVRYEVKSVDFEKGRAELVLNGDTKIKTRIARDELLSKVSGKSEALLIDALSIRPDIARFSIRFFPPWRKSAPVRAEKIRIEVQEP